MESVFFFFWIQVVKSRAYAEDLRLSNVRLLIGSIIIAIALLAQFYPKKFPENRDFLIVCIGLYPCFRFCCLKLQFTKDGVLVEGLFWKDVEKLIDDYNGDRKSK
ncbi:hypothetical protein BHE74_00031930 [Ensete ventricosum]|nr:hypothetical protein BHE74_00031930 [Ensete ventricosum]